MSSSSLPHKLSLPKLRLTRLSIIALLLASCTFIGEVVRIGYFFTPGAKGTGSLLLPLLVLLLTVFVSLGWWYFLKTEPQPSTQIEGKQQQVKEGEQPAEEVKQSINGNFQGYQQGYQIEPSSPEETYLKTHVRDALPPPRNYQPPSPYLYKTYRTYDARCFIAPKEGNDPRISDDKYAIEAGRYAVADGASTSFQPSRWAEELVKSYVKLPHDFRDQQDFQHWLKSCSERWEQRVRSEWLPYVKLADWEDPDAMIAQGAQSTFIGCTLKRGGHGEVFAHIFAIGDANFFLFRPSASGVTCEVAYPLKSPERSSFTETLLSTMSERKLMRAWDTWLTCKKLLPYPVQRGDCIVLATDEMAIWLLKRMYAVEHEPALKQLLSITDERDFQHFVAGERKNGNMELDDTTMLIIPFLK